MPRPVIQAIAQVKKAAAITNQSVGGLSEDQSHWIQVVCDEILAGDLWDHFPLKVYQTGSGTQTNMNVNEVIANRGNELAGQKLLHPNDQVNRSQSSNDVFPTAMHLAAVQTIHNQLLPALEKTIQTLTHLANQYQSTIKSGRTHLQDATPVTFGQEVSGWCASLMQAKRMIKLSLDPLYELAIGGTAVGTGINADPIYRERIAQEIAKITGLPFQAAPNKFHALSSKDELVLSLIHI